MSSTASTSEISACWRKSTQDSPHMDTNPCHVGPVAMTIEEEEQYFVELHRRRLVEVALLEHEQERQRRMPEEIQKQGREIQWLRTREREDFPTYSLCSRRHGFSC
jgi:hypothetical protein